MLLINDLGMRGGAFVSALLLFTVPLTFLGMVRPQAVFYGVSAVLCLLAVIVALYERRLGFDALGRVVIIGLVTGAGLWMKVDEAPLASTDYRVVHEAESHYGWVRVIDDRARRVRCWSVWARAISLWR